ncbi:unnamed protein product [Urochloa humidicola]
MAAGWMTRACALAIATAACVGLPAALVYAIVRVAAARRFGATFALATVLVFWVTISLAYYPRVCCDIVPWSALLRIVPWSALLRRLLRPIRRLHPRAGGEVPAAAVVAAEPPPPPILPPLLVPGGGGGARIAAAAAADDDTLVLSYEPRRRNGGGLMLPLFVARGQGGGGMDALPREPPAARGQGGGGEACKHRCAMCLCDVEEVEAAAWLPACLHMFHRQCFEQWLHKHGHSTCPICRSDAFAANGVTTTTFIFPDSS